MKKFIKVFALLVVITGVGLSIWGGQEITKYLTTSLFNAPSESIDSTSGLVGYWDMNLDGGSDGTVYDKSRYSNNGTNSGATAVEGKIGAGMSFDGENDSVNLGDVSNLDLTDNFTISLWAYRKGDCTGHCSMYGKYSYVSDKGWLYGSAQARSWRP